jgi:hypothetical protein
VSLHPLVDLSLDKEVRKAAGFRAAAAALQGEELGRLYREEVERAPRRGEAGRRYLVAYNSRLAATRRPSSDADHLALALVDHAQRSGEPLPLPDEAGAVQWVHAHVPLKGSAGTGEEELPRGVSHIDLLGLGPADRLVVGRVRFVAPTATRGGTGDTPLRALLEGLAHCAIVQANRDALSAEIAAKAGRGAADAPPLLILLGSPRYWELCRRREAQKGAAWIKELERLAQEIDQAVGVAVIPLACQLQGDPGWSYPQGSPVFDAPPRLVRAWEYGAGRVRPKPRPKPKSADASQRPVEADPSRPIRSYSLSDVYAPGDRIAHPTLGLGVVQSVAGPGKISVLFGDRRSLLVHARPVAAPVPEPSAPAAHD